MLTPPAELDEGVLAATVSRKWHIRVATMAYRAVGFGSHHWSITEPSGGRWFVTVDELDRRRRSTIETLDDAYRRLRAALDAACALAAAGAAFVVGPVVADGEPVIRLTDRYTVAVYPLVDGESYDFGDHPGHGHQDAVRDMLVAVHSAPEPVRRRAPVEDFTVPHRDTLIAALAGTAPPEPGPYAVPTARLLRAYAPVIRDLLVRYDRLVATADLGRVVLTHGEPHAGNTMRTAGGWRLIDWDAALVAPPERDLWMLDGDHGPYTEATGILVRPDMLDLYRLRWDIADIAAGVDRFRRPHSGDANDDAEWTVLEAVVAGRTS